MARDRWSLLTDPRGPITTAPEYCEAYPALKIIGARAAWQDKRRIREWHNERLELVARVEMVIWNGVSLDVGYEWVDREGKPQQARAVFDVIHRPTPTDRRVPWAMCPACADAAAALYLVDGAWKCAGCHKLVPRASLLNSAEKILVKVRRLAAEVNEREPPVRGFRTWDRKRLELMWLETKPHAIGVTELREHLRAQVTGEWIAESSEEALDTLRYPARLASVPRVAPWFGQKT